MENELNALYRLTETDIVPAALTLAKAFQDYPLINWFIPDSSARSKTQSKAFRGTVLSGIRYGEVYATSLKMESVAVWYFPGERWVLPQRKFSLRRWLDSLLMGREQVKRIQSFGEYANAVRKQVVPGKHFYLQVLGVDPAYQGQGYSSRLLKPVLVRADREGLPCFLETQAEKNIKLYEHFGFKLAEEGKIPGGDLTSWAMVREPEMTSNKEL